MTFRRPVTHDVRSWSHLYRPIKQGMKLHDLRINDRNYQVGDFLKLREYDIVRGLYTGDETLCEITYITGRDEGHTPCAFSSSALHRDYCLLSIRKCEND